MDEKELCINCHEPIRFGRVVVGEWAHWHGDKWCHKNGYTATPLRRAQPAMYPPDAVL